MRYASNVMAVAAAVVFIIAVALGARVYRWELYVWPACIICWAVSAGFWQAMARRSR